MTSYGERLRRRSRTAFVIITALIIVPSLFCVSSTAWPADTGLAGFNVNTDHFTADVSGIHSIYGSRTLGHLKPAFRLTLYGSGALIEAGNPVNNQRVRIVDDLISGDLSASVGLSDYVDIGLILPIAMYEQMMDVNTQRNVSGSCIGDLLLDAKVRMLRDKKGSMGLGFLARLSVPTGNESMFVGWKDPTGELRLILDKTVSSFYVAANVGYRIAAKTNVRNNTTGAIWNLSDDDRLTFGLGASYALPLQNRSWDIMASVNGDTLVSDLRQISTPVGFAAGVRKRFDNGISIEAGGGRGLTDAVGSPSYRVFASLAFDGGRRWRIRQKMELASKIKQQLREVIYFAFDEASISDEGMDTVRRVAGFMEEGPDLNAVVSGHSDSVGDRRYNYMLGLRRAQAVADGLVSSGIDEGRIELVSYGEANPVESNGTAAGRAKNRRVDIEVK